MLPRSNILEDMYGLRLRTCGSSKQIIALVVLFFNLVS